MDESTRVSIRQIFLNPRPFVALMTAAGLLGISFQALKREIAEGTIVAEATGMGVRVPRREMMAAAMRTWTHEVIEEALGDDAARVLPEAIRLVALDVRVPRYQRDMVRYVAEREGTTISDVVTRELEGMASAGLRSLWESCRVLRRRLVLVDATRGASLHVRDPLPAKNQRVGSHL